MKRYQKILFVCEDNTCRSVMAETIMRAIQHELSPEKRAHVSSRGLVVLFEEPYNAKAVAVLRGNHLEPSRETSQQLEEGNITENTLVLTMTTKEKEAVAQRFPGFTDLYTLREFDGETGDITEPYGGSLEEYEALYEHMDLMVKMAAQKLAE